MRTDEMRMAPGHLIRRAQQANSSVWAEHVGNGLTSLQFAILNCLDEEADIDQTKLGRIVGMDRSTTADIVKRLVRRRLIRQVRDPSDNRRNVLILTAAGRRALKGIMPSVIRAGSHLVAPLTPNEQRELIRLISKLVDGLEATRPANGAKSLRKAPSKKDGARPKDSAGASPR